MPFPPFEIPSVFPLPVVHDYTASTGDSATTGTLSLRYDFADDVMAYASFSTGFKSGGISLTGMPPDRFWVSRLRDPLAVSTHGSDLRQGDGRQL